MAHEIEQVDGKDCVFTVGDAPWHKLGQRFVSAPSLDEAIVAAGLDWTVSTEPVFTSAGEKVDALATRRSSDNSILGVVGPQYTPVQNRAAFDFFAPFIDSKQATIETAGSLRKGQRVWVQAKLAIDPIEVVKGDEILAYVLLSNSHDGSTAVRVGYTPRRVVCQNTLTMAHNSKASKLIRIRHTKNVNETLDLVRDSMDLVKREFVANAELYQRLARRDIVQSDFEKYVQLVFNTEKKIEAEGGIANINNKIIMKSIQPLFEKGRGNDMVGVRGTAWAALNSVSEYLQYYRGADDQSRLDSLWFGAGGTLNQRALEKAVELFVA
jgi:phage/plasmid-like protein (TIGR03299 family)